MKEPTKVQRLLWWIMDIPLKIKQSQCYHHYEHDMRENIKDKWGRCSGADFCTKCFKLAQFTIFLFEKP